MGDLSLGRRTKPDGTIDYTNFDHTDANVITGATLTPEDPLAGYFARPEGSWIVFHIVVNNAGGGTTVQPVLDANEDLGDIAALPWAETNPDTRSQGRCGGQL
jgi:D-alanyl-D-alanine carboxypeptidase/D-alanyl-D-alanine-endopeptidase (penicillin-binding protein 4)